MSRELYKEKNVLERRKDSRVCHSMPKELYKENTVLEK
jgi:hypothetical protein